VVQPITCSTPQSVGNIETAVIEKSWNLDSAVSYNCKEGFIRKGPATITCQLVDGKGEWSDNPPICELPTQGICVNNICYYKPLICKDNHPKH